MKITARILIFLGIVMVALYGCRKDDLSEDLLKPWKAPEVELTGDVALGAYYNISYNDTNWLAIDQLYLPALGKYNSFNQDVIRQHLDWSLESGIDFWIISHNQVNDSIIQNVLPDITGIENMQLVLDFSLAALAKTPAMDLTDSASIQIVVSEFRKMKSIFDQPNYLKIDGKPLVVLQGAYGYQPQPNYLAGEVADERPAAIAGLRTLLADSTGYEYFFVGNYIGWTYPARYPDYVASFDALTTSMFTDRKALSNSLNENIDLAYANWTSYLDSRQVDFIPAVFPGRNDTITSQLDVIARSESFFTDACKVAKYHMDEDIRMILVNSFNNWHSGTQVEPADTYGNAYIEILKEEFYAN
jgi:hypothetical protein